MTTSLTEMEILAIEPSGFEQHSRPRFALPLGMSMRCQRTCPGDVTMTDRVQRVPAFAKRPTAAIETLAQRKIIGRDVLFAYGKALLRNGELVHQREPEVMFLARKIHRNEPAAKGLLRLPADLLA